MLPGVPYEQMATAPAGCRLKNAIAAIMRKTVQPVTLDASEITIRWEYLSPCLSILQYLTCYRLAKWG
jgi:hypothetical protein